jgi:DNA-binding transcriptional regulator YbjK
MQLWLAYVALQDADEILYAYPRADDCNERVEVLHAQANRLVDDAYARIGAIGEEAQGAAWKEAIDSFLTIGEENAKEQT